MAFTEQQYVDMSTKLQQVKEEIHRFIVGQEEAIDYTLYAVLADGHALLEGLPGLGKTMLIRTISEVLDLSFSRIQFTPDLMPADITGTSMIERTPDGKQQFTFQPGPIFSQMVLADEINRATPKTQSALLEAMGEKTVTILGDTKKWRDHFSCWQLKTLLKWKEHTHYQKHRWTVSFVKFLYPIQKKANLWKL